MITMDTDKWEPAYNEPCVIPLKCIARQKHLYRYVKIFFSKK